MGGTVSSPSNFSILFVTMLVFMFHFPLWVLFSLYFDICHFENLLFIDCFTVWYLMLPIYDLSFCNFILLWCIFNALNVLSSFDSLSFWKSVVYRLFYSLVFWSFFIYIMAIFHFLVIIFSFLQVSFVSS